jgi:hypothetical protein
MPDATLTVVCEILDHDHGHWCRTCNRSAGVRAWLALRIGHRLGMQVKAWCGACGSRDIEVGTDGRHR